MTAFSVPVNLPLALSDGLGIMTAFEVILKGLLEADFSIESIFVTRDPAFLPILTLAGDDRNAVILKRNGIIPQAVPTAARGVRLAMQATGHGRNAVACVPNEQIDEAIAEVASMRDRPLGPGACTILVDP